MKTFLTINIILLLLSACSYDNAFSRFDISSERANSEEGIESAKLYNKKNVVGVISYIYLNTVNPQKYNDAEYFYIYLYVKEDKKQPRFVLNDINASSVLELLANNKFTALTGSSVEWKKYYFVKFAKQEGKIKLTVNFENFSSDTVTFKKDD